MTRGVGTLGLNPNRCKKPVGDHHRRTRSSFTRRSSTSEGMEIVTVPTTRNLHSALNPAIKSLNYLNNILAKIEANNAGCEEAIMLNAEGFVAECTGDNMFIVKDGQLLHAAAVGRRALRHHARAMVMELAARGGPEGVARPNLTRYDLFNADECFLTGTGAEIVPVVKIDGRVIGTGKPGPVTRKLVERVPRLDESVRRADIRLVIYAVLRLQRTKPRSI